MKYPILLCQKKQTHPHHVLAPYCSLCVTALTVMRWGDGGQKTEILNFWEPEGVCQNPGTSVFQIFQVFRFLLPLPPCAQSADYLFSPNTLLSMHTQLVQP